MDIVQEKVIDLLDQQGPALSSVTDMPVVETKPDATPAAEPESTPEPEQPEESATPATDEAPAEPAKKESRGVQKALDRLTAEREAEKRRADEATEARIRLEERLKLLEEQKAATQPATENEPVKPSLSDFPDPESWQEAMLEYTTHMAKREAAKEFERLEAERKAEEERVVMEEGRRAAIDRYNERVAKVKEKHPDFEEVGRNPNVQVPPEVINIIVAHEEGAELQYYLGQNPEVAAKLMTLPDKLQILEAGRILAQLSAPPPKPAVSAAPRPIRPITSGETIVAKDPESMSMEEYAAYRREQSKASRVRH